MKRALWLLAPVAWFVVASCLGDDGRASVNLTTGAGGSGTGGGLPTGLGVGEACTDDGECRPGLACEAGTCQPGHSSAEGDPCVISGECEDGLFCDYSMGSGVCAPAGEGQDGAGCASDADCASGFRCTLVGLGGQCTPEGDGDLGAACEASTDCFGGLACLEGFCSQPQPGIPPFGVPWAGVDCPEESGKTQAYFRVPRGNDDDGDFFRLPIPNDVRLTGGQLDLSGFPTPGDDLLGYDIVQRYVDAVESARDGWGMYQNVYFRFSGELDFDSLDGNVHIVDLTSGNGTEFSYFYSVGRTKYMCASRLAVSRGKGRVWEADHTYAVYLDVGVKAEGGGTITRSDDLIALLDGSGMPTDPDVAAHYEKYAPFRQYLLDNTMSASTILNASVFTIGNPRSATEQLQGVIDGLAPAAATEWTLCDTGIESPCPDAEGDRACQAADPDFHELHALVDLPIFQQGTAPYLDVADGGDIKLSGGTPEVVRTEQVCLALSVPKGAPPDGGWPTVVHAHGTGGSFRSHIGSGIAKDFATGVADGQGTTVKAAVMGIDQVQHGSRRNGSDKAPQDLFFNFANPKAATGNPQQGAADQMALLRFVPTVGFDEAGPTGEIFNLSATAIAFWGHSQGATAGGLALPYGDWSGAVLSGQGGSLRDALVSKTSPVNIAAVVPFVLSDFTGDGKLPGGARHPVVNLLQHYIDGGDPVAYARLAVTSPPPNQTAKHVFQPYGQEDTFTPAAVQQVYLIGAGLGTVAPDGSVTSPDEITGVLDPIPTPASGNKQDGEVSALYRQYKSDGGDGHFVAFDVDNGRSDTERFLAGILSGVVPQVGP